MARWDPVYIAPNIIEEKGEGGRGGGGIKNKMNNNWCNDCVDALAM